MRKRGLFFAAFGSANVERKSPALSFLALGLPERNLSHQLQRYFQRYNRLNRLLVALELTGITFSWTLKAVTISLSKPVSRRMLRVIRTMGDGGGINSL